MESLEDNVAIVAGGTGSVGEGLVRALLRAGAEVVVPYRNERKKAALGQYVADVGQGRLHCLPARLARNDSAVELRQALRERFVRIDLAVACLGGWYYGHGLHRMPFEDWRRVVEGHLHAHFLFMQSVLPVFYDQNRGTYIMVNGSAAEMVMPDSGVVSVMAAAQAMMTRVLCEDAKGTGVRA